VTDLEVPRRIDKTIGRVAKSRSHARNASKSRRRRKALKELQTLRQVLEQLQMRTIDGSLPPLEDLEDVLNTAERRMKAFAAHKPKRRRLRKLTRGLKRAKKELRRL
jgi:hypothetical protein